jgi:hypothetical protein
MLRAVRAVDCRLAAWSIFAATDHTFDAEFYLKSAKLANGNTRLGTAARDPENMRRLNGALPDDTRVPAIWTIRRWSILWGESSFSDSPISIGRTSWCHSLFKFVE